MRTVALTKESTKDILENLPETKAQTTMANLKQQVDEILNKVKTEGDAALFCLYKRVRQNRNQCRYDQSN